MQNLTIWPILGSLLALLALLAWIGWTYFLPRACRPARRTDGNVRSDAWERIRPRLPQLRRPFGMADLRGLLPDLSRRHAVWIAAPLLTAGIMVAATLIFARRVELDPLQAGALAREGEANLRLNQEKLLPPPTLPPSTFINTEVPNLESADRDWNHLDQAFAQIIYRLFDQMARRGYPIALLEGYRSPERQELLAAKGPTVTRARANQSKHQYGLAVDVAPMRNGRLVISERDPWAFAAYQALGEEAGKLGLTWGGNWTRLADYGHVESPNRPAGMGARGPKTNA